MYVFMTKKHITMTIDDDVWFQIRTQDINLSGEVNDFLKARLKINNDTEKETIIKKLFEIRRELKRYQYEEQALTNTLTKLKKEQEEKEDDEANAMLDSIKASGILAK